MLKINDIKLQSIYYLLTFLFALFTTFEVFKTKMGGITILYADFFYFIFVFSTLIIFFKKKSIWKVNSKIRYIVIIFFSLILCTLNALPAVIDVSFDKPLMDGSLNAIKYVIRNLFQLIIYICICFLPTNYQNKAVKGYCYGFLMAIILHSIYSIIQMIYMYFFLIDIHTIILNSLGITKETINHDLVNYIGYPILRNCGFHWDPAYFGLWGCIGLSTVLFCSKRNRWIKFSLIIIGVAWSFSFSRSGYLAFVCGVLFILLGHYYNNTIYKINIGRLIRYGFFVFIGIFIIYIFLPSELQDYISYSFNYRFTYNPESKGTERHIMYPLWAIEGSIHDLWHFIFGYGPRNSSRGIAYSGHILEFTTTDVYDIESDFCKMLLSYGIISFVLYLLFNYYIVRTYIKNIDFRKSSVEAYFYIFGIVGSFIAGIFYMYNDSKWIWFLYLFALLYLNNNIQTKSMNIQNERGIDYHS